MTRRTYKGHTITIDRETSKGIRCWKYTVVAPDGAWLGEGWEFGPDRNRAERLAERVADNELARTDAQKAS